MSELYMIVLQGREELGDDPEAVKLWSELSGVDIESINESTPFDIEIADKLLRTLPEVIEKVKERKKKEVEEVEKGLETLLESKEKTGKKSQQPELLEVLKEKITKGHVFEQSTEEEPAEVVRIEKEDVVKEISGGVRFVAVLQNNRINLLYGDVDKYKSLISSIVSLTGASSFHISFLGDFIIYGDKSGNRWIVAGFEESNLGVVKSIMLRLKNKISS